MIGFEGNKQHELKSQLQFSTTASQSLVREIEELKGIHKEQLMRLQTTDQELESITRESEELYLKLEKDRAGY